MRGVEKRDQLSMVILSSHLEVPLPRNDARTIIGTFLTREQVKWNLRIQRNFQKLCRNTTEIQGKHQQHNPASEIQTWLYGQNICLPMHYTNNICYARPQSVSYFSIPVTQKKQNVETEAFSLMPCDFQLSPSKYYFQEQCRIHSLEKPRTVNHTSNL